MSSIVLCEAVRLRISNARADQIMDFVHVAISARLAHGDLIAADAALEAGPDERGVRLVLIK